MKKGEIGNDIREKIIINRFKEIVDEYKNNNNSSYKEISDMLNMSSQSLTNYTTSRVPNIDILTTVCTAFDVSLDYMCGLSNIKDKKNDYNDLGLNKNSIDYLKKMNSKQNNNVTSYLNLIIINELFNNNTELLEELVNMILAKYDTISLDNFDSIENVEKFLKSSKKRKIMDINTYLIAKDIEDFIEKVYKEKEKEINSII